MKRHTVKVFEGFSELNSQHLLWLKRKLARGKRYERMAARRLGGEPTKCSRHRKPLPPVEGVYDMRPWRIERSTVTGKPIGRMVP